jgi:hypothetical protein
MSKIQALNFKKRDEAGKPLKDAMKVTHVYFSSGKYRCAGKFADGGEGSVFCKKPAAEKHMAAIGQEKALVRAAKEKKAKTCNQIAKTVERRCNGKRWAETGEESASIIAALLRAEKRVAPKKKKSPAKKATGEKKKKTGEKKKKPAKKSIKV